MIPAPNPANLELSFTANGPSLVIRQPRAKDHRIALTPADVLAVRQAYRATVDADGAPGEFGDEAFHLHAVANLIVLGYACARAHSGFAHVRSHSSHVLLIPAAAFTALVAPLIGVLDHLSGSLPPSAGGDGLEPAALPPTAEPGPGAGQGRWDGLVDGVFAAVQQSVPVAWHAARVIS